MMDKRINLIIFIFFIAITILSSQDKVDLEEVNSDPQREEVQRYFGYESLLYRYLTQPYDISINVNEQGDFVDVSFLYLMFIPILLLLLASSRKLLFSGLLIGIISLWIISTSNSFVFSPTSPTKIDSQAKIVDYLNRKDIKNEPISRIVAQLYFTSGKLYPPYKKIGELLSGDKDAFTYPFLFFVFIGISLLITRLIPEDSRLFSVFLTFAFLYSFYWLLFGGGIIWYCYIMFPVCMISIFILLSFLEKKNAVLGRIYNMLFYFAASIWLTIAIVFRISAVAPKMTAEQLGKGIYNSSFYEYGTGKLSKVETLDKIYPNLSTALERINSEEESIIYKVGTSFNYFIKNNHQRVYQDHQLGTFYWLLRQYTDKAEIAKVLKASNIRYLILDLNTPGIDNTPDKSLRKKYRSLRQYVDRNPTFKLLATDKIVSTMGMNNTPIYTYNTVGEVYYGGSYAIYEIL